MADFDRFFPGILKREGSLYTDHPADKGGPTKFGITLRTWQGYGYDKDGDGMITANDIKLLTAEDARRVYKKIYWDHFEGDHILNQSVAELIVDWGLNSGSTVVSSKLREILGLQEGTKIKAAHINKADAASLFEKLKQARIRFIEAIVRNHPDQKVFYKGWMNRISAFGYIANNPGKTVTVLVLAIACWYLLADPGRVYKFMS